MNSILQMLYSNPYIRRQIINFKAGPLIDNKNSPDVLHIAKECMQALQALFVSMSYGQLEVYDANSVFAVINPVLMARNKSNINATKVNRIKDALKNESNTEKFQTILQDEKIQNPTDKLSAIKELLKQETVNVWVGIRDIVREGPEAQQDATEFFVVITECMSCYGLTAGLEVLPIQKRACVSTNENSILKQLKDREEGRQIWLTLQGTRSKTDISKLIDMKQEPEIFDNWNDEDRECVEILKPYSLQRTLRYTTTNKFNTLFLYNFQLELDVPYKLEFTGKHLLLKGACLYKGTQDGGHYIYVEILSRTQCVVYNDATSTLEPIKINKNYVTLKYKKKYTISKDAYCFMYVKIDSDSD